MAIIIFALLYTVMIPIALYFIFIPEIKDQKISNGIRNQDAFSQNYLYKMNYEKSELLRRLNLPNVLDTLEYTFDSDTMTINFCKYNVKLPCVLFIKEFDGGCYVRLKKRDFIGGRSNVYFYINEFMIKKFDAELLPYDQYNNIVE